MPSTSAGVWTAGPPLPSRADEIASDMIVTFKPALAYASPEMVSLAPGLAELELRPIVNGALALAGTALGVVTAAPPDVAASAAGAATRAVAAIAPMPASLRDEMRERGLGDIEISLRFRGGRLRDRRFCGGPHGLTGARRGRPYAGTAFRLRHY